MSIDECDQNRTALCPEDGKALDCLENSCGNLLDCAGEKKRDGYFDLVKFFVLFFMLWGHAIQYCSIDFDFFGNPVFKAIYGFHMPLFALVSGWFFFFSVQKYSFEYILKKKCLSMAFSIVSGNFLYWAFYVCIEIIRTKDTSLFVNGGWIDFLYGLWFLWAIMIAMAIVAFACKKVKNRIVSVLVVILGAALFFVFPNSVLCIFVYPYFLIGFAACKYKDKLKKFAPLRFLSIPLYPLLVGFYRDDYYIYVSGLWGRGYSALQLIGIDAYRFVTGVVGCVFVLTLVKPIFNLIKDKKICRVFADMGSKSLQVYVLQTIAYYVASVIVGDLISRTEYCAFVNAHWQVYSFVITFAFAILLYFLLYAITNVLYKTKIGKIVFGR